MSFLEYNQSLVTGHREIDIQHKRIITYLNSLYELNKSRGAPDIIKRLEELLSYIDYHFLYEEKLMSEIGIEKFSDHIAEHKKFKDSVKKVMETYSHSEYSLVFEICKLIKNFCIEHIFFYDKVLVKAIK